ncbi:hypothetical protein SKAU_G00250550 [Synaphobranchus kaupii]|uniref:Uncharacterized protein n=1 Tax=Synaphobranchus kaupii TaxID=118154 RepID=A0A9Q1IRU3_SYNKA|nr:hypothetical protein SKAU_G00250550 [Synaphobranchus kaupii]
MEERKKMKAFAEEEDIARQNHLVFRSPQGCSAGEKADADFVPSVSLPKRSLYGAGPPTLISISEVFFNPVLSLYNVGKK